MTISITTDSFELTETDVGSLAVGEAKTIQTESGHVVDILRTPEGAEVYIDGELVDIGSDHERLSEELHVISSDIAIECADDSGAGCEKHLVIEMHGDGESHNHNWIAADEAAVLHENVEITCADDDGETTCTKRVLMLGDENVINIEKIHEEHEDGKVRKVIVITSGDESES